MLAGRPLAAAPGASRAAAGGRSRIYWVKLTMTPACPRLLDMINDFVLLRFWARPPEDLSPIEAILLYYII